MHATVSRHHTRSSTRQNDQSARARRVEFRHAACSVCCITASAPSCVCCWRVTRCRSTHHALPGFWRATGWRARGAPTPVQRRADAGVWSYYVSVEQLALALLACVALTTVACPVVHAFLAPHRRSPSRGCPSRGFHTTAYLVPDSASWRLCRRRGSTGRGMGWVTGAGRPWVAATRACPPASSATTASVNARRRLCSCRPTGARRCGPGA